jgi:NADH:ubiquinone oxidoreductase subunit 3 (subunit A)
MWWQILIGAAVVIIVGYAILTLVRFQTRLLTRRTSRTANDMYDSYADPLRQQRRYTQERGGEWKDE